MIAGFTVHFVDAIKEWLFALRRFRPRQSYFNIQAVERASQRDSALRGRGVAMKTVLAGRHNRVLELQNHLGAEAGGIGQVSRRASDGRDQAIVGVHMDLDLVG